jgi:hypothetical protein
MTSFVLSARIMTSFVFLARVMTSCVFSQAYDFICVFSQGYDFICAFGGRGFSILDPSNNMNRTYDSGDDFERYFTTPDATEADRAVFNANVGNVNNPQSSEWDRRSFDRVRTRPAPLLVHAFCLPFLFTF